MVCRKFGPTWARVMTPLKSNRGSKPFWYSTAKTGMTTWLVMVAEKAPSRVEIIMTPSVVEQESIHYMVMLAMTT